MKIPDRLLSHARRDGLVLMAGAGISADPPSSLPTWYKLNRLIVEALSNRIDEYLQRHGYTREIVEAIDARRNVGRFPPDYQAQIIEEVCGQDYFSAIQSLDVNVTNDAHAGIGWLARYGIVRAVVTTNFDPLIEHALDHLGVPYDTSYDPATYQRCLNRLKRSSHQRRLQILKVHGCVRDRESLIDTLKQRLLGRDRDLDRCLKLLLERYYWVFVGFSAADLETDCSYLQLIPSAHRSPGLTFVKWPGEKKLRPGARKLLKAYGSKATRLRSCSAPFFRDLWRSLGAADPAPVTRGPCGAVSEQIESALARWAGKLHPAAAVTALAGLAEANGDSDAAFRLLHRFWKDVNPSHRRGPDFDRYRFHHGRLGMGGGIVTIVNELETTVGEQSLQNLYRRAKADPRAMAWAGMAWLWAGQVEKATEFLSRAGESLENDAVPAENRADIGTTLVEAVYVLGVPDDFFRSRYPIAKLARRAGDLPREARFTALAALVFAEFNHGEYPAFLEQIAAPVFQRAERLNDPVIAGFRSLAQGRYLTKAFDPAALEPLGAAIQHLQVAGRPPWVLFASIEYAKALMDHAKAGTSRFVEAADILNHIDGIVDRYQVWLPWLEEAKGQFLICQKRNGEARRAFESAIGYAMKIGLKRKSEVLKNYLIHVP